MDQTTQTQNTQAQDQQNAQAQNQQNAQTVDKRVEQFKQTISKAFENHGIQIELDLEGRTWEQIRSLAAEVPASNIVPGPGDRGLRWYISPRQGRAYFAFTADDGTVYFVHQNGSIVVAPKWGREVVLPRPIRGQTVQITLADPYNLTNTNQSADLSALLNDEAVVGS